MSPQGKVFNQKIARSWLVTGICLYMRALRGIDERVMKKVDMELSIGDYVLTGGELPAMAVIDAVIRFVPG